jgi:hypothetical protein
MKEAVAYCYCGYRQKTTETDRIAELLLKAIQTYTITVTYTISAVRLFQLSPPFILKCDSVEVIIHRRCDFNGYRPIVYVSGYNKMVPATPTYRS